MGCGKVFLSGFRPEGVARAGGLTQTVARPLCPALSGAPPGVRSSPRAELERRDRSSAPVTSARREVVAGLGAGRCRGRFWRGLERIRLPRPPRVAPPPCPLRSLTLTPFDNHAESLNKANKSPRVEKPAALTTTPHHYR